MWCRTNCWFGPSCFQEGSSHWDVRLEPELCVEPSFWLRPQVVQRPAPGSFDLLVIVFLRNQTQSAIAQPTPLFLSSCLWWMEAGWENQHLKTVFHCCTANHRFTLCTLFFAPRRFNDRSFLFCTADKNLTQKYESYEKARVGVELKLVRSNLHSAPVFNLEVNLRTCKKFKINCSCESHVTSGHIFPLIFLLIPASLQIYDDSTSQQRSPCRLMGLDGMLGFCVDSASVTIWGDYFHF